MKGNKRDRFCCIWRYQSSDLKRKLGKEEEEEEEVYGQERLHITDSWQVFVSSPASFCLLHHGCVNSVFCSAQVEKPRSPLSSYQVVSTQVGVSELQRCCSKIWMWASSSGFSVGRFGPDRAKPCSIDLCFHRQLPLSGQICRGALTHWVISSERVVVNVWWASSSFRGRLSDTSKRSGLLLPASAVQVWSRSSLIINMFNGK